MKIADFETGLVAFAENYVLPNLTDSTDRWMLYFGLAAGGLKLETSLPGMIPVLQTMKVISADGDIDIDALERFGKSAFQHQPKVKLWKLTFTEPDFDALISHLRTGCQPQSV